MSRATAVCVCGVTEKLTKWPKKTKTITQGYSVGAVDANFDQIEAVGWDLSPIEGGMNYSRASIRACKHKALCPQCKISNPRGWVGKIL